MKHNINGIQKKKLQWGYGGILIASILLLTYSSVIFIDVQKSIQTVTVNVTEVALTIVDDEVNSITLTFMVNNPSERVLIQIRHFQIKIISVNENETHLTETIYPPYGEIIIIHTKVTHPFIVKIMEIAAINKPAFHWALVHEKWRWQIFIRVVMDVGYSQHEVSNVHHFDGADIRPLMDRCTNR